ncbi:hypothetical protein RISK_002300 [Rhodopirellula islandica]|uniref:DUF4194 domain-containing protein n=1 Tax=Rhodopirellula islandica TaxID=595434 RepID=A0A0J1BGJ4_RHOIS|nr:DUF4194 domain-containing protein [Rhodopirellula islandica]KLU05668.1 hypothetical protein RISK_002300 [Rhodopirellula islandica]
MTEPSSQTDPTPDNTFSDTMPPPVPWAPAAVRLLQGIVYHDDAGDTWERILSGVTPLTDYFARIGLQLIVNEEDGMAYLRQIDPESLPPEYPSIPKLFRSVRLTFEASLLCVLLREELRQFEEEIHRDGRCVVTQAALLEVWQSLAPTETDDVRANRNLGGQLRKLEELKFVRQFEKDPPSWEVRRILKARLPLQKLERLRADLEAELERRDAGSVQEEELDAETGRRKDAEGSENI